MARRTHLIALGLTAAAPLLWSTGGLGVRLLDYSPWVILFWRGVFMACTVFIWSIYTAQGGAGLRRLAAFVPALRHGGWVIVFISMSFILYVLSVKNTTVADSLLIQGTAPIFIVVLGWIVLREPIRGITVGALAAITIGILVIMVPSLTHGGFSGNVFGLLKALVFAAGTITIRRKKEIGFVPTMALAAALSALVAAGVAVALGISLIVDRTSFLILLYLGAVQVGAGYILFVSWSRLLEASETGLLVILEAVLGPIWVWIVLSERPSNTTLVGGGIILAALVAHTLLYTRRARGFSPRYTLASFLGRICL